MTLPLTTSYRNQGIDRSELVGSWELAWTEVIKESGDIDHYTLTLLKGGTLLLQTNRETDGMPWVSYGWYTRVD